MNMDIALQTFVVESGELLQEMENLLLNLPPESEQADAVNSIFRAAHTIKGSAGLFALDVLVEFTHVVESILNDARAGKTVLHDELVNLLLECKDCIGRMIAAISGGAIVETDADKTERARLVGLLEQYLHDDGGKPAAKAKVPAQAKVETVNRLEQTTDEIVANGNWHLSVNFGSDVLRDGMDPLSFLRYLNTIGKIKHVETLTQRMPVAADMDAETNYLSFEINYQSDATKETIEKVFEFVKEDCKLVIMPPNSKVRDYIRIIESYDQDEFKLGEILVRCGTLTERELAMALDIQKADDPQRKLGEMVVKEGLANPEVVIAALNKQMQGKKNAEIKAQTIRVDAQKLDQLINLIGELVISGSGVEASVKRADLLAVRESTVSMMRLVEEVRDSALNLRMVQIGETFNRFQRVVRDVSKELGKSIELRIHGADTELDKTIVEKISDPLMHLVRNSIDHGIEGPELRQQRGKPAEGVLQLNAYHESGSIVIEVSDDGGGINTRKVLEKAIKQGMVQPDAEMSEQQICALIFEAGFSTADQVSNISGRGVGMDVVRRNIEALRGSIEIDTVLEVGTTMRIRLPLTLAIIDGFMMKVGGSSYVVPLDIVEECMELDRSKRQDEETRYIELRGEALPYIRLGEYFSQSSENLRRENMVVIRYGNTKAGLVVDELVGEFQTVIKPLGSLFNHLSGISGSTILGSGEVALILDAPALIQQAIQGDTKLNQQRGRHQAVLH